MTILESCIQRPSIKYGALCAVLLVFSFGSLAAQGQEVIVAVDFSSGLEVRTVWGLSLFHCLSRNGGAIVARVEQTLSRRVPAIAATFGRP